MTETRTDVAPDPNLLAAVSTAVAAEPLDDGAAALAAVRATGEWLAERLEVGHATRVIQTGSRTHGGGPQYAVVCERRCQDRCHHAAVIRRLCGVPAPGAPDMCHNDHPFEPGIDMDAPTIPDPRWCNVCGETRRPAPGAPEAGDR